MNGLNWEDIAAADDCEFVEACVKQWGEDKKFYIKTLTVSEAQDVAKVATSDDMPGHHLQAYYIGLCCYKLDKKSRLIPKDKVNDFKEKQANVVASLFAECKKVNAIPDAEGEQGND